MFADSFNRMMSAGQLPALTIWHIPNNPDETLLGRLTGLLDEREQQRAMRLNCPAHRQSYIHAHAALRAILARLLQTQPHTIRLVDNRDGKPGLATGEKLFFNLSHTTAYSILALSPLYEVGIDIETVDDSRRIDAIARRFYNPSEYEWLAALPPAQRIDAFYRLWCLKEAALKATGKGIQGGLASFSLSPPDLDQQSMITDTQHNRWWLHPLAVPDGYRAAVAIAAPDVTPVIQHWQASDWL